MPEVDLPSWLELLLIAGGGATALLAILAAAVKLGHVGRWLTKHITDELAERVEVAIDAEGLAARVESALDRESLVARVEQAIDRQAIADDVEAKLSVPLGRMLAQLEPNGGTSLHDSIRRVEQKLKDHTEISAADRQRLWTAYGVLARHLDVDEDVAPPPPNGRR